MNTVLKASSLISVEEYLAGEKITEIKHEYVAGQVFAMTGASIRHSRISGNLFAVLHALLGGNSCQVFIADIKVHCFLGQNDIFYYPDLMVCCNPEDSASYYREHPCLLVEVLSKSTRNNDLREKLFAYTSIGSLQAYLVLEQELIRGILYRRDTNWRAEEFSHPDTLLTLPCAGGIEVTLGAIYSGV